MTTALTILGDRGLSQFTAKAWVNFNGTGTVAIRDSHNVSSITDDGIGLYRMNFTNAMANANYCPVFGNTSYSLTTSDNRWLLFVSAVSTTGLNVKSALVNNGASYTDKDHCLITIFGD